MAQAEISEAPKRGRDLLGLSGDWVRPTAQVARHSDIAAGRANEAGRIAADITAGGIHLSEAGHDRCGVLVPDGVPGVGVAGGEAEHAVTAGADQDGRAALGGAWATRLVYGSGSLVERPVEVGLTGP